MRQILSKYSITNSKLDDYLKAFLISDIHNNYKALEKAIEYIKIKSPDIVLIPGDVIDSIDENHLELFKTMVKLCSIARVYISIGNHDNVTYKNVIGNDRSMPTDNYNFFENLKDYCEVFINTNEGINIGNNIELFGVTPPYQWYPTGEDKEFFQKFMQQYHFNEDTFNLVLSHSPNGFIYNNQLICDKDIDLILSGHNHGGMVPQIIQDILKNGFGLFGPYAKILFPNAYGIYENENSSLIISNGVTKVSATNEVAFLAKILNFFYPPNVEELEFFPGEEKKLILNKRQIIY